ncbi:amidohydrolase family protein [Vreelandella sp. GE22]
MQVVDPHLHFWALDQGNQPWLENPSPNLLGDYTPMARDFGPQELFDQLDDIELMGLVHVEADADDPVAETQWLTRLLARHSSLDVAMVAGVDLSQPEAPAQLEAQLELSSQIRGVRQILNVHQDPLYDYVGRHYMEESLWQQNMARLAQLELSFDLQIYPSQMTQAAALAARHPDIQFVLNHAGMYVDRQGVRGWREWRDGMRLLARQPNIAIKLSGFGMLDHHWSVGSIRPLILEALDAFGVERCLFASNYPVDGLYAGYQDIWRAYAQIVADASQAEHQALFVKNARRIYRF